MTLSHIQIKKILLSKYKYKLITNIIENIVLKKIKIAKKVLYSTNNSSILTV